MAARVLIVDDIESHRYIVGTWLRRAGFTVVEAATGAEALAKVRPDLDIVVLDVNLPDMSGFDVCAAIKSDHTTAAIPVMHMSATAVDVRSRARGLNQGADAYLVEPLAQEELIATIRALIRIHAARRKADRLAQRLSRLAAATLPVNAADTLNRLLEAAAAGATDVFGEPSLAAVLAPDGGSTVALCAVPGEAVLTDVAIRPFPAGWLAEPVTLVAEEIPPEWQRLLSQVEVTGRRWHVIPIPDGRGLAGCLATALPVGVQQVPETDADLLQQLADAIRVALGNLRAFTEEHRIALTLQRALLPGTLPDVGSLSFGARYLAASDGVSVGGDFYDVFELPSGQVAVVIGDVQGHSLQAATVMAELRFSLRAYLAEGHPASTALALLDAMLQRNHPEETATVALLLFDASATHADLANAGHLPPLHVTPGAAGYLEAGGALLGATDSPRTDVRVELPEDSCVVLVTDGLIERRGESLDVALARLHDAVLDAETLDPDRIADALLDRFVAPATDDDIAVLVVRVRRTAPTLQD